MKLKKLVLKKEVITSLEKETQLNLKGGVDQIQLDVFSDGCSDGCLSKLLHTVLMNCSKTGCTDDCC